MILSADETFWFNTHDWFPNAGDGGEPISLKAARWLHEGRTLLTMNSSGEIHIFSKQGWIILRAELNHSQF